MPYRDPIEDPRVDAVRRTHISKELIGVREVVRRFADELDRARTAVDDGVAALDRARNDRPGGFFARRPTVEDIEREERELTLRRTAHKVTTEALALARSREVAVAELLETLPATPAVTDPNVHALAGAASLRAATIVARDALKVMRAAATAVIDAHRGEMLAALAGDEANHISTVPRAEQAVGLARCHVELLRASFMAIGGDAENASAALGDVIAKLEAAGTGPGQHWRDQVVAAAARLDAIVDTLGRA